MVYVTMIWALGGAAFVILVGVIIYLNLPPSASSAGSAGSSVVAGSAVVGSVGQSVDGIKTVFTAPDQQRGFGGGEGEKVQTTWPQVDPEKEAVRISFDLMVVDNSLIG